MQTVLGGADGSGQTNFVAMAGFAIFIGLSLVIAASFRRRRQTK